MIVYFNGEYIFEKDCKISPFDRGFLFSDGVYEVIKYTGKKFFEFDSHIERLNNGLRELEIYFKNINKISGISKNLFEKNKLTEKPAILYIQITRGISNPRNHLFPDKNVNPTVFINISEFVIVEKEKINGVKVILTEDNRWGRCDIKTTLLLPNVIAMQKSHRLKSQEAVFVRDGYIMEGTHTSFAAVRNGCLFIPPLSNFILPGITRKFVIKLCNKIGIPVVERNIRADELEIFDEFMLMSTKSDVVPVIRIDEQNVVKNKRYENSEEVSSRIHKRKSGKITEKIRKTFLKELNMNYS